jgi:small subunit ribosomal protein S20
LASINKSAEKRNRQNIKRREANKATKTSIRTSAKKVVVASKGKSKTEAETALKDMIKKIDTAARKGIVTKNAAARKKSRMQRLINTLEA